MKISYIVILMSLFLVSCGFQTTEDIKEDTQRDNLQRVSIGKNDRFKIERVSLVYDTESQTQTRGIYIITDKKNNKEYLGVSGIGISELYSCGKTKCEN